MVRTTLDLPFEGRTLDRLYALGDLLVEGELADDALHIFSSRHGLLALFPLGGRRVRLIAGDAGDQAALPPEPPSLDTLQRYLDERAPGTLQIRELGWSAWFRINSRMVPRLRAGHLLLGGDAAHIHSPAGAQGMNTGIQDMIDLGWKLAFVIKGEAPDSLLDSYAEDRLPVMRDVLLRTERLTEMLGAENAVLRAVLERVAVRFGASERLQANALAQMSQIALGYRSSPLSADHPHEGELRAGDPVPDLVVRCRGDGHWHEARLHDLLDPSRFVLLVAHATATEGLDRELQTACGSFAAIREIARPEGTAAAAYKAMLGRRSNVFLVRPDGYVGLAAGPHSAARALSAYRKQLSAIPPA